MRKFRARKMRIFLAVFRVENRGLSVRKGAACGGRGIGYFCQEEAAGEYGLARLAMGCSVGRGGDRKNHRRSEEHLENIGFPLVAMHAILRS